MPSPVRAGLAFSVPEAGRGLAADPARTERRGIASRVGKVKESPAALATRPGRVAA